MLIKLGAEKLFTQSTAQTHDLLFESQMLNKLSYLGSQ